MHAVPAIFLSAIIVMSVSTPLRAEDPVTAVQTVIESQIKAFLRDDAEAAYSFAAPGIKARFPDKSLFFAMVKKSYAPVYHPGNYAFGRSRLLAEGAMILQELTISGRDGNNWKAVYKMTRQPDASYKIDGVVIVPDMVSKGI